MRVVERPDHICGDDLVRGNFRPDVVCDIISDMAIEWVSADVPVKFGGSRSNRSRDRDIGSAHLVMDERTTTTPADGAYSVLPKMDNARA